MITASTLTSMAATSPTRSSPRGTPGVSVEEVQEIQVLTNNYNAEYGQAANAIVEVITKSGSNDFHGDFHAYLRARNLGASS
jgi:hypothetical protein